MADYGQTILLTGATGQVGGAALRALALAGTPVRVLARAPVAGVDVVVGSFDDEDSLRHALDGVDVVFLTGRDNPDQVAQHLHSTATLGTFGAAAACARLAALDEAGWERALALAAVQAAGLTAAFGTMAKPVQVGKAAANGLMAALLAEQGVEAPADPLEGDRGMLATHAARPGAWPAGADEDAILRTLFKRHACCHGTHAAIDAVALLREEHDLHPAHVVALRVDVAPALLSVCNLPPGSDGLAAKFSLRTLAAMALRGDDTADPATFSRPLDDPALYELAERVVVRGHPALSDWQTRATLTLDDRRVVVATVDVAAPERRPSWGALAGKFERLAAPVLGRARAARVPAFVRDLDPQAPVRTLTAGVRVAA
jgi:2-methylcitrate dehydratase PrpD